MWPIFLILGVLGLVIGSFINALIPRLHNKKRISKGRSQCPHCRHTLAASDLIPLLSFVLLGGKCRYCKKKIHWHYPATEAVTALTFVLIGIKLLGTTQLIGTTPFSSADLLPPSAIVPTSNLFAGSTSALFTTLGLFLFFAAVLIAIALYDILYMEIPDPIVLPAIGIVLVFVHFTVARTLASSLAGAALPVFFFGTLILVSRGAWMGGGDLRIGALIGLFLGWQMTLVALAVAYVSGAFMSILLIYSGVKTRKDVIPFGPFLVLGALCAILIGPQLRNWYWALIS